MADNSKKLRPKELELDNELVGVAGPYLIVQDAMTDALVSGRTELSHPALEGELSLDRAGQIAEQQHAILLRLVQERLGAQATAEEVEIGIQQVLDSITLNRNFNAGRAHLQELSEHTAATLLKFGVDGITKPRDIGEEAVALDELLTRVVTRQIELEAGGKEAEWAARMLAPDRKEQLLSETAKENGASYRAASHRSIH